MARVVILRSRCTGGIEPRVERVAQALATQGHQVTAFLWDREGAYPRSEVRHNVAISRLPLPAPYNRPLLLFPMLLWFIAAFRATRAADVVHACDLDTLPPALGAKVARGRRVAYDIFDFYGHMLTSRVNERTRRGLLRLEAALASFVDVVFLVDSSRREVLPEAFPKPVEVVMNTPVDANLKVETASGFVLFYGGNLAPDRGLLEAIAALHGLESVEFRIAGTGELAARIRTEALRDANLTFMGELEHGRLLKETARAHAVLAWYDPSVPANRYASPNKLYEAMMLRRPCIVSAETRMAELVSELGCGIVVAYGDSSALQEAVTRLRDNPSDAELLGRRGRQAFEREYSWENSQQRLGEAYRRILGG